ncbi:hypothetical protein F3Y22_tig00110307pilonHSYRG00083 [Hibiscus syriacus]|uniref:Integrase catalytic domain-containing protein n=1 Tax=Hibiscus syriacus TaxID=106335 RepID=A0A6A3B6V3_HIBSY|nr:hypothetical protein F3Y22_tig00110307pilonHSYRG00083 [Hibiscus syriacus]
MQSLHPISEPTFVVKAHSGTNTHKNIPLCSHCNILGHTKERCYKLIGYPPGYNSKNWYSSNSFLGKGSQVIHTNYVVSQQGSSTVTEAFTPEQCQQLIVMLTSQLQIASSLDIPTTSINISIQGPSSSDWERSTWVYLLQHKSDVSTIIHVFISMIKKQFDLDIKSFRSDNAPELNFTELFANLGIIHQFSYVETPQQNSVVERKHQHLVDVARALYFQSKVPIKFWGDCLLTATYLINRLSSPVLNNKYPYEVLYGHLPDYSRLRAFGCLCFVSTLKSQQDKFSTLAFPVVFLGYSPDFFLPRVVHDMVDASHVHKIEQASLTGPTTDSNDSVSHGPADAHNDDFSEPIASNDDASLHIDHVSPSFYHQAVKSPTWRNAMDDELRAMENLETWTIVPLPDGKKHVNCKLVYRVKYNADGSVDRCKARLVAKGFQQVEGIDYMDTFSPVAKMTSFRALFSLEATCNWNLLQLDVNNAFLNGILDEEVYMKLSLGYKSELKGSNMV